MNRLYLVRHGENLANLTKELSCRRIDYPLTPKGVLQAQQTAAYFRERQIDEIYASPLRRARETAEIIGAAVGLPVTIVEEFREVDVGELEGRADAEAWTEYFGIARAWFQGRHDVAFPGGEDYRALLRRMRAGIARVVAGKDGRGIVVVGHGGLFTATIGALCQNVDLRTILATENHNCSVTELAVALRDGALEAELVEWAACGHLSGAAADLVGGAPDGHMAEIRRGGLGAG
jgi:broad specificity phosphatase PhoE